MERINRSQDENLYQPKIVSDQIRKLYQVKLDTGVPLTVMVYKAIGEYLEKYETENDRKINRG